MASLKHLAVLATSLVLTVQAQAAYVQTGVRNDVSFNAVVLDGWQLVSQSNYGDNLSISDMFAGLSANSQVMIGAMQRGSGVIDVLAGATLGEITTYTAVHETHAANGVEWYFNGSSMGFAGLGKTIYQNSADVNGLDERDRLSWHTTMVPGIFVQDPGQSPLYVYDGWRSGNNTWIYEGTDWDRVVFTTAVPEPETYAMMLAGLALVAGAARRRKQANRQA